MLLIEIQAEHEFQLTKSSSKPVLTAFIIFFFPVHSRSTFIRLNFELAS